MNPPPTSLAELDARLAAALDSHALPSVAVGIWQRGEVLLRTAYGFADREAGLAATAETAYSLASVTKPLTATAVALLAERNFIHLDAPVNRYLDDVGIQTRAGDAEAATVRRVAGHTAGLPLYYRFYYAGESDPRPPFSEITQRYAKTFFPPGEGLLYSNLGYGLLDALIERVSGVPYAEFMAREVFAPLGMEHSAIGSPAVKNVALSYGLDGVPYPPYDFDHPGGSAAYASVDDLLAFGRFALGHGPAILSLEARAAMFTPSVDIDTSHSYGLGWGVAERHGVRIVGHTGSMGGVSTVLQLVPEADLVVTVLVNGQSELAWRTADDAIAALLPEFRAGLAEARAAPPPAPERTPIPTDWEGIWRGAVETHAGDLPLSLELRNGRGLARLGEAESPIEALQMRQDHLLGVIDGEIGTEDAGRLPHRIHLNLLPRDGRLQGAAVAISHQPTTGGAPGLRLGNALPYWTDLKTGKGRET